MRTLTPLRLIHFCFCVGSTRWERHAETPGGFQDPKHEVKHGPLARTGPLRSGAGEISDMGGVAKSHTCRFNIQVRALL